MKRNLFLRILTVLVIAFLSMNLSSCELFNSDGLSDEEIAEGLKEALSVGTTKAVSNVSQEDGYFGNLDIKIPFPPEAQLVETAVRALPLIGDALVNELVLKVNRAAEDAATAAEPIFLNAITNVTIVDASNILFGADDAATQYLNDETRDSLKALFLPSIQTSLNTVGATTAWDAVITKYNGIPGTTPVNADLAGYTTDEALDGLFHLVKLEELKIRQDPIARVSDLLKKVFAELDD